MTTTADLIVVGAGAAGLATAIAAARTHPRTRIMCLDGARSIGAKILISGGSRCNVTNRIVTERDFWGGSSRAIKAVLRAFPASRAVALFEELGVPLHEEEDGKLFPDTHRSRTVLDALLRECERLNVEICPGQRVRDVQPIAGRLRVTTDRHYDAHAVALATGGRSLPKSGSDGSGYDLARRLGHGYIETTPALVPLILRGDMHARLSGVSHRATITVRGKDASTRLEGALLWTHFGASGPVVLNASRHWHRAALAGPDVQVSLSVLPDETNESLERRLIDATRLRSRATLATVIARNLPMSVAQAFIDHTGLTPSTPMGQVSRDQRRALGRALLATPLDVTGSRGYMHAEVTSGGTPLDEVDVATMASRICPGLYLTGEMLDVDGRLGGFNFQWAWSTGWVAGTAIGRALRRA